MSTPIKLEQEQRQYSFRNTPTRNTGEGAYGKYFKNAVKIRNENDLRKSLFNSTTSFTSSSKPDDLVSLKKVVTKQFVKRQTDLDSEYNFEEDVKNLSSDEEDDKMSITSEASIKTPSKAVSKVKKESNLLRTPSSVTKKTKSTLSRRSTISSISRTPSMQKRVASKIDQSSDALSVYEKARIKLHVANTPDCLPCRDKQFTDIFNFIETNLKNQTGGCMYVCGVPGTGKTLTTRQVILCLKDSVSDKTLSPFRFIEVNAFQVTEPHQIYKLIYKELTDENVSAEHAVTLLEKKFEHKSSESIVLLVDELDMLCTKKQDVLYNLFDWPYKKNSRWIVIAIANAMNLPEQVMNKISSRLGLSRLIFQPYKHVELEEIVRLRLQELNVFDMDAIVYAARKVAAVSGDARRALEICRRATELAENDNKIARTQTSASLVNISHVDQAIKQMFSSAKITALTNCSKMEKLFMKAICMLYQKSGMEETSLNRIIETHNFLCRSENIQPLNRTQLLNVCCSLASTKLILLEPCKNIYLQRIRCNMSIDDIEYVLNDKN